MFEVFEVYLDGLIAIAGAYIAWLFFAAWRQRHSSRALMMSLVFLVIAVSHTMEVLVLRVFKMTAWLWLADETTKTLVMLLALIGTAAALAGTSWRGTLARRPPESQEISGR